MSWLAAYGLLAQSLIFGALIVLLPLGILRQKAALMATTLALLVGIAPAMHGIFGTPSVTLLQLALLHLADKTPSPFTLRPAQVVLALALLFYPLAWGIGPFDPYALGFQPQALLLALAPLAALLSWRGQHNRLLLILSVDLLAYSTGIFPNLWDVLLDPLLVVLAFSIVARHQLLPPLMRRISARGNR
jgi:hypothetical protein